MNGNNSNNGAGGYFRVQDRLFDWYGQLLGPIAIAVYNYLSRCADQDGCCFPSYKDIARKVGISRRAAIMAINKLGRYGLIEIQHRKNRREKRGNYTSNRYKIRLEAFTHAGAHREVVHEVHQVVHEVHQVVHEVHPKDYPLKDNPNKEKEREGEIPPSTPPESPPVFSNSPQEGETSKVGGNVEAATAQSAGRDKGLGCQNQAVKMAAKANGKPTTGRKWQHQGNNGAGRPLPVPLTLSDDEIEAAMQAIGWTEAQAKIEAPKFRDHHLRKATLSYDWQAELRLWKRRGDEYAAKNGKPLERKKPPAPLIQADQGQAIQINKEVGKAHMAEIRRMIGAPP
jgi:DNA-binding Lrp family transcriptional regulator